MSATAKLMTPAPIALAAWPSLVRQHVRTLFDVFGVSGVLGRLLRAIVYVALDYTSWVCAVYTWANTASTARLLTEPALGLRGAYLVGILICLLAWSARAAVWNAGYRWALSPSLADLLTTPTPAPEITIEGPMLPEHAR